MLLTIRAPALLMNDADYRYLLHLLNTTLALFRQRTAKPDDVRRRFRAISREIALLRARFGQPAPCLQRN